MTADHSSPTSSALNQRLQEFVAVLADSNHLRAFALMAAMMFASFMMGPYVAIYLEFNVGIHQHDLKFIYLCGGLATILTTTPVGWLADRFGKLRLFRATAVCTIVPIVLITLLPAGTGLWIVLVITTAQMVTMSSRMVPAMAMITGSAAPGQRGGFMSLNTAVQHLSAGVATAAGGALLAQPVPQGPISGYPVVGLVSCGAVIASLFLAGRLRLADGGNLAPDEAVLAASDDGLAIPDRTERPVAKHRPIASEPGT